MRLKQIKTTKLSIIKLMRTREEATMWMETQDGNVFAS